MNDPPRQSQENRALKILGLEGIALERRRRSRIRGETSERACWEVPWVNESGDDVALGLLLEAVVADGGGGLQGAFEGSPGSRIGFFIFWAW